MEANELRNHRRNLHRYVREGELMQKCLDDAFIEVLTSKRRYKVGMSLNVLDLMEAKIISHDDIIITNYLANRNAWMAGFRGCDDHTIALGIQSALKLIELEELKKKAK